MTSGVATENLLTKEEVCILLGVSYPTLHRWVKENKVPSIKIGSTVRFSPDVIKSLVSNSTVPKTENQ
jgi:excisionase family DNA binding protein